MRDKIVSSIFRGGGAMKKILILAIGLLCAITLFPQSSQAYSILFGPSLFSPRTENIDYFRDATILFVNPGSVDRHFTAPVFLPNGARVSSVVLFFKDNSRAHLQFEMKRMNVYNNREDLMLSFDTEGNSPDWRRSFITRIAHRTIDNSPFLYYFSVWFSDGDGRSLALRAIKIKYELII
jgi:hypothetical protein